MRQISTKGTIFSISTVSAHDKVMENNKHITRLLVDIRSGESDAYNKLFSIVYDQLRDMARYHLRFSGGNKNQTLSKTGLVHEAYIKLIDYKESEWENRAHFYAIASKCMRHILVDLSRKKRAEKRGGKNRKLTLDEEQISIEEHAETLIDLSGLIDEMAGFDKRKSQIVEMRFFGGMTIPEISEVLNVSSRTVDRDWLKARAWLLHKLKA